MNAGKADNADGADDALNASQKSRAANPAAVLNAKRAAENLQAIRQLMERPVRYSTMSGLSGLFAGAAALAGLALDWHVCFQTGDPHTAMWINAAVWAGVFMVTLVGVSLLTTVRERRQGIPFWSAGKQRILATIAPPFLAAAALTAAIAYRWYFNIGPNEWGLIPSIWMCFYGVACWQVGAFTTPEIRVMGAAFVLSAFPAAAFYQSWVYPYWTLGATFGGFHLIYGLVVWIRYGG